jgi:hypothetical protein
MASTCARSTGASVSCVPIQCMPAVQTGGVPGTYTPASTSRCPLLLRQELPDCFLQRAQPLAFLPLAALSAWLHRLSQPRLSQRTFSERLSVEFAQPVVDLMHEGVLCGQRAVTAYPSHSGRRTYAARTARRPFICGTTTVHLAVREGTHSTRRHRTCELLIGLSCHRSIIAPRAARLLPSLLNVPHACGGISERGDDLACTT